MIPLLSILKKSSLHFISGFLLLMSCTTKEDIKILTNKDIVSAGEMYIARIYVDHTDSVAPEYFIIKESDTIQFNPDPADNYCGLYRAIFQKPGKKTVYGFVDFLDKRNKWQIEKFILEFEVTSNPDSLSMPQ